MRYILFFLVVNHFLIFAYEDFFYDFAVRSKYSSYFKSNNVSKTMNLAKHHVVKDYYIEVSRKTISSEYVYYSFFNRKENVKYILPGSYVIKVGKAGIEQIKIFFINRGDTFIRIKPNKLYSSADFYLLNNLVYKDIVLPFSINDIAVSSLNKIISHFSRLVDFKYFIPEYLSVYENISNMLINLRKFYVSFHIYEVDDGAMNENGEMVYIKTGQPQRNPVGFNCSGFVKWIADSIYHAMNGKFLNIEDLKIRHIGIRGNSFTKNHEFNNDPFFGLDWIRNIAYRLKNFDKPFNLSKVKENDVNNVKFLSSIENRGYKIEDLEFLMYILALDQPGYIYFGSISTGINKFSGMVFHKHVVSLFPFLSRDLIFKVSVNEVNAETSIKSIQKRYPKSYIHLVRVKVPENLYINFPILIKANNQNYD